MNSEICPLCKNISSEYYKDKFRLFHLCFRCKAVFVNREHLPDKDSERSRYYEHNNNVNDVRYQNFVNPIVSEVISNFRPENTGLDFGAGTGPVISKLLRDKNFNIKQYDPFFHNDPVLLQSKYDYIICCEVMEHFHKPDYEFKLLKKLLNKNGKLYCMTSVYNQTIDFKSWNYKNDITHVIFYQKETLHYILENFGFSDMKVQNNLIVYSE